MKNEIEQRKEAFKDLKKFSIFRKSLSKSEK